MKKFIKEPGKQYKRKFRIYLPFVYNRLDKWLKSMSLKGWHIVHCGLFYFLFEKGKPTEKEYFTYTNTQEGKYSISLMYPLLEKTYGVKKKKSKINSNEAKAHTIIEIDLKKVDVKNDIGYKELINDRNRLYRKYFAITFSAISISIIVLVLLKCLL